VAAAVVGLPSSAPAATDLVTWQVAPGVVYSQSRQQTPAGPQVVHELDIDPGEPGIALDYATNDVLRQRRTVRRMLDDRPHAVAGANGTYFDIDDVGAPLGFGSDLRHGPLHAESTAWANAFWEDRAGRFHVGPLSFVARVVGHPHWPVTGLNSPHLAAHGIGIYTSRFGNAAGLRVVDGNRGNVRQVVVRGGVVRSTSTTLSHGDPIRGVLLVGRGAGADDLATLEVGQSLDVTWRVRERPQVALSGGEILLQDGAVASHSDHLVAPRTAIAIDRDTGHLLLVVVDGRSRDSHGLTLRGVAHLMAKLGAEDALDLDGGASSTLVARRRNGVLGVLNTPSAGHPRRVPDALVVTYRRP
jgi:hypothetical protein